MINRSNASERVLKHGNGYKVVFVHKGVILFLLAMEFRDKISLEIEKGIYKLKRPIGIFKKKSKTQKLPYLVSIDDLLLL